MKKIIFAIAALSLAGAALTPAAASIVGDRSSTGVVVIHHHYHHRVPVCHVVKTKTHVRGRWVVTTRRVCR
jgi:hypothetical protein